MKQADIITRIARRVCIYIVLVIMAGTACCVQGQTSGAQVEGSKISIKKAEGTDTLIIYRSGDTTIMKSVSMAQMPVNPHTATMYAAIVPGLGQIYNRKYWKLPFVYGGIAALCYSINFNSKWYKYYRRGYRDLVAQDPNNAFYVTIFNEKINASGVLKLEDCIGDGQYAGWFKRVLENKKDYYRRYRDLSYFGMIGVYVVQLVDACVDAHFHDFDVSDDLALHWSPLIVPDNGGPLVGATVSISF
ncbi:MAG: DUF5683 domain-containing protein [Bacteroidia bacterium]|nr:DUF5683 domain-containing protein [Bacteroidia bacterium]